MGGSPVPGGGAAPGLSPRRGGFLPSPTFLLLLLLVSVVTNILFAVRLHAPGIAGLVHSVRTPPAPLPGPADRVRVAAVPGIPVIVYNDFQCPFSARIHETLRSLSGEMDLTWVFRHFPLKRHPMAARAAEAAECAGDQGQFWEYADILFERQENLSEAVLREVASALPLDQAAFGACLDAGTHRERVTSQMAEGERLGISGTPTFFVGGRRFDSALPYLALKRELLDAGGSATSAPERCD